MVQLPWKTATPEKVYSHCMTQTRVHCRTTTPAPKTTAQYSPGPESGCQLMTLRLLGIGKKGNRTEKVCILSFGLNLDSKLELKVLNLLVCTTQKHLLKPTKLYIVNGFIILYELYLIKWFRGWRDECV